MEDTLTSCNLSTNTFDLYGSITFENPPSTGLLTITNCQGISDTLYPPFSSPSNFSLNLVSDHSQNCDITAIFTDEPTCSISLTNNYPSSCLCTAEIGTFTTNISSNIDNVYQLCFGDTFKINANGDYTPPNEALSPDIQTATGDTSTSYSPGVGYMIYTCSPTVFPQNNLWDFNGPVDSCLMGLTYVFNNYMEVNSLGAPNYPGNYTNNTVYYVPITFYDTLSGYYSYTNTGINCYAIGPAFAVQYLPEIIISDTIINHLDNSFTITINGGLPEIDGSIFTASNLLPSTASFVNDTSLNGGTIQINGLQNGDMYSFIVTDNSCGSITINGGPFIDESVGLESYLTLNSFKLYPNPTNGDLVVEFKNKKIDVATIEIYNNLGELKFHKMISYGQTKIKTASFSNGLYNIIIKSKSKIIASEKLIIMK